MLTPLLLSLATWQSLGPGVEYRSFELDAPTPHPHPLHVVRIDPKKAILELGLASREGEGKRTAGAWADTKGWAVAINAGMFQTDHLSNVGHLSAGAHRNHAQWRPDYHSLLAFRPRGGEGPRALLVNRPRFGEVQKVYTHLVQNLRLIGDRRNRWTRQKKRWSEAAVASDDRGRVLFLFTRAPYSMYVFNHLLLKLPLGIVNAMHVEGGPEASLSVRSPQLKLDLHGSFETDFNEADGERAQWPIPNALGARSR